VTSVVEEVQSRIDSVTVDDLKRLSAELFAADPVVVVLVRSSRVTAMTTRVGVIGAYGKMANSSVRLSKTNPRWARRQGWCIRPLKILGESGRRGPVDVTNAQAAEQNLPWLALHEIHAVVGTSESVTKAR